MAPRFALLQNVPQDESVWAIERCLHAIFRLAIATCICLLIGASWGAEPDEPPEIPSALDGLLTTDEPGRRVTGHVTESPRSTGAWFVWPLASSSYFRGPPTERAYRSNFLGATLGRRWYAIGGPMRFSVETAVSGEFPLGPRTRGRLLRFYTLAGPRSRLLSLLVGPVLTHNALHLERAGQLPPALHLGAQALLQTDLGALTLFAGIEPVWLVHGTRPVADYPTLWLPGFGDEFSYLGGVSIAVGRHWRVLLGDRIWLSSIGTVHLPTLGSTVQ